MTEWTVRVITNENRGSVVRHFLVETVTQNDAVAMVQSHWPHSKVEAFYRYAR